METAWLTQRPFAHRGLHNGVTLIENTLQAFEAALEQGYGIEIDVQVSADGRAVVFHDYTLERLTVDGQGKISDWLFDDLTKLSIVNEGGSMLSLEQFLEYVDGRVPLLVEIKSDWKQPDLLITAVAKAVSNYKDALALMSFDPYVVRAVKRLLPMGVCGLVAERMEEDDPYWSTQDAKTRLSCSTLAHIGQTQPDFLAFNVQQLPTLCVNAFRRAFNRPVLGWTVRSAELEEIANQHLDQVIFEHITPSLHWRR